MTDTDKEARENLQKIINGDFPEVNISIGYEGVQSMELKIRPIKILTQEEADALSPEEQKLRLEELERITSETAHEIVKFLSKSGYRIRRARTIFKASTFKMWKFDNSTGEQKPGEITILIEYQSEEAKKHAERLEYPEWFITRVRGNLFKYSSDLVSNISAANEILCRTKEEYIKRILLEDEAIADIARIRQEVFDAGLLSGQNRACTSYEEAP